MSGISVVRVPAAGGASRRRSGGRDGGAGRGARPATQDAGEPSLGIVAISEAAVIGEIAVGVIGRRNRADHAVLVERGRRIADGTRRGRVTPPMLLGCGLADAPVGRIVLMCARSRDDGLLCARATPLKKIGCIANFTGLWIQTKQNKAAQVDSN